MNETVFVTGGSSGIGEGLASAFHARGARVIISGRDRAKLQAVAARHDGMEIEEMDVADAASIAACHTRIASRHLRLDVLINNAGMQKIADFSTAEPIDASLIAHEINTNLFGLIEVSNVFLPLLKQGPQISRLVHVGSGLAFTPLAAAPIYSATKAGVHAFTVAVRHQLAGTSVRVIELIPPAVETALHAGQTRKLKNAMPLARFVTEAMAGLDAGRDEVSVGLAKVLRIGSRISPGLFLKIVNKA